MHAGHIKVVHTIPGDGEMDSRTPHHFVRYEYRVGKKVRRRNCSTSFAKYCFWYLMDK